jgi:glyoxylase-like metal-dependent hydrolase (beta-lactamase superfamily II)
VTAIALPLPLEGLTSVNCYVLRGDAETVLVDPGWSSAETEHALLDGLDALGLTPADIGRTLTTHHHWDHYTQGLTWQRTHDIPVHLGRGDAPSIHAWHDLEGAFPRQVGLLRAAGARTLSEEVAALPVEVHEQGMDFDLPAAWLDDGDVVDLGGLTVRVLATPGHTRGHLCFEVVEDGLLLTGDHVLPRITPSIAYEREPSPDSLTSYLGSLRLVADLPDHRMLPAHGVIGDSADGSAAQRAKELIVHHDERLDVVRDLVAHGHATAHEVAMAMTWTRRSLGLDELELNHAMTAVLEVAAHLVVLERNGLVARTTSGEVDVFASV